MINAVIIEDERIIAAELQNLLFKVSPEVKVIATLPSIKESLDYFTVND